jgi:hypothetical protein
VVAVHLFGVRFFAEVKMGRDGVFEKMNEEVADQDEEQGVFAGEVNGFWNDLDEGHAEHVTRAQREEILQVLARPFASNHEIAAENVASGGDQAKESRERDSK